MHLQSPITQLPLPREEQSHGLHVAIISDGNGRWGVARGLPRTAGHRAGADTVRRIVEAAPRLGIGTLTLFALSSANWKRPPAEVNGILRLLHEYLLVETTHCVTHGVRLSIIGRRDRLSGHLREAPCISVLPWTTLHGKPSSAPRAASTKSHRSRSIGLLRCSGK